jgi:hypothetical protein
MILLSSEQERRPGALNMRLMSKHPIDSLLLLQV